MTEENTFDLIDDGTRYDRKQFCAVCRIDPDVLVELVEEGVIYPENRSKGDWVFSYRSVRRFKRAYRLQRDLELNLTGVAVSVDLLDEIDALRQEIATLRSQLTADR